MLRSERGRGRTLFFAGTEKGVVGGVEGSVDLLVAEAPRRWRGVRLDFEKNDDVEYGTALALTARGILEDRRPVERGVGLPLLGMDDLGVDMDPVANLSPRFRNVELGGEES